MRRVPLLRVECEPRRLEGLLGAAREAKVRVGWIDRREVSLPASLEGPLAAGASRAVAAVAGRVVAAKAPAGEPVLRDLVREYFLGCALVLVAGEADAPVLRPAGEGWEIVRDGGRVEGLSTGELLASLDRPSRWR